MKRAQAAALFTRLIERQEAEGRDDATPCLMLTGCWYDAFPKAPPTVAPLPDGRAIYLLNLKQGREIRDVLADQEVDLGDVAIEIKSKTDRSAVGDRHTVWQRNTIRAIVKRSPGHRATRYLREEPQ